MGVSYGPNLRRFGDITTSGLFGKRYVGNYSANPDYFKTATLDGTTQTTTDPTINSSVLDNFSWMWVGYFRASTTETYTFSFNNIDDNADCWLGTFAVSGYTIANRLVGGTVFSSPSATIALTSNFYYPIRIMFGEGGGNERMIFQFSTPTISTRTDGTGFYFGGQAAWNRFGDL